MAEEPEERAALHLMLPVLIERELDFDVSEGKNAFIEAVRGDLEHLIDVSVPEYLFKALLKQRRVLVIEAQTVAGLRTARPAPRLTATVPVAGIAQRNMDTRSWRSALGRPGGRRSRISAPTGPRAPRGPR